MTIGGAQEGDTIYYTVDGTDPYSSPTRETFSASSAITVTDGLTVRAIIKNSAGVYSYENKITYTLGLPMPEIVNKDYYGEYSLPYAAELFAGEGDIYYTLDGSDPKTDGTIYTAPISIDRNTQLRAVVKSGSEYSEELDYSFRVTDARQIELDTVYQGYVPAGYYSEWFQFTIPEPGKYSAKIIPEASSHFNENYQPIILYDKDKITALDWSYYSFEPVEYVIILSE